MSVTITNFAHGTTTDNENEISSGWHDVELSELGVTQAAQLREIVKDKKFDVVFCSDLKRAVDTAILSFEGNVEIIPDPRLRECYYGELNAGPSSKVEPMCEEECIYNRFPEGESYEDVKERMADFLKFLKESYDGKSVAIVSHKAPQLALEVLLNGKTWEQALKEDWRKTKSWQPGWEYKIK
jgi:broad specificity phosphatase PhoE